MESSVKVVLCNCPPEEARPLARTLVSERLAACVNVLPGVASIYRWKGQIEEATEVTLLIKTADDTVLALGDRIRQLHSYDTVEILALPVDTAGSDPRYMAWVDSSTQESA